MLDAIIASQKEKNPGLQTTSKSLEDALAGHDTLSAADLKKLLAGGSLDSPAAPASNVIDIAQDIKILAENSEVERANDEMVAELIVKDAENTERIATSNEEMQVIQQDNDLTHEEKLEQIELVRDELEVLRQIESNTRQQEQQKSTIFRPDQNSNSSSMLSGIMGFLGGGLTGALGGLFAGAGMGAAAGGIGGALTKGIIGFIGTVFKTLLKGATILLVVGGIASGLVEGIKEYKETGELGKAIWAGLAEFVDFISLGLINKEDMDKLADYVSEQWKLFEQSIKDFIDFITPDFLKKNVVETDLGKSETAGVGGRMLANTGDTLSTIDFKSGNDVFTGSESRSEMGRENDFTVTHNGKQYKVDKQIYKNVKMYLEQGYPEKALYTLEANKDKIEALSKAPVGMSAKDVNSYTSGLDFDENALNISVPEKTNADVVVKQSESNAAARQDTGAGSAPILVNAPTTNTSMQHTTSLPQVKPRNDESTLSRFLNFPGFAN